jgi:hypothetical protein
MAYTRRMLLLTWFGTILRLEKRTCRLTHSRLVPHRDLAADFAVALPPEGLTGPLTGPDGITLHPGAAPGIAHLSRDGLYLFVSHRAYPSFTSTEIGQGETCLLVTEAAVAVLRDLLSHLWTDAATGAELPRPALDHGHILRVGAHALMLAEACPAHESADPGIVRAGALTLRRVPDSRITVSEWPITPASPGRIPEVADDAAFRAATAARFTMPAPPETAIPPLILDEGSRDFLYRRARQGRAPECGRIQRNSQILRGRDKFVLLQRRVEGMILDGSGVLNEFGYIGNLDGTEPPHFGREGDRYFLDRRLLETAPVLRGPHAVFYGGNYQNYYHWLIDAILPLSMMAPYLPPEVTLLLPGTLDHFRAHPIGKLDYVEALEAFGFGSMARVEVPGQICRVEEIFWPDQCTIENQPATALRAARDRAITHAPEPAGDRTRIYVRRQGDRAIANEDALATLWRRNDIVPVMMEDLTVTQQIDLFRRAELVISPHGAALANILFCPAATAVLELSPDCEYRPFFNQMAAKLGLSHAVLPCPTDTGGFNGRLDVDSKRLQRLLNLLQARQAR